MAVKLTLQYVNPNTESKSFCFPICLRFLASSEVDLVQSLAPHATKYTPSKIYALYKVGSDNPLLL